MLVQDEIEEGIKLLSLYIYIYTYIHFSIHVSQTNPGFRVAFGAVVAATEISGIDLGMIPPPFFPQGRARSRTNKRTNPQHGVEEDCRSIPLSRRSRVERIGDVDAVVSTLARSGAGCRHPGNPRPFPFA